MFLDAVFGIYHTVLGVHLLQKAYQLTDSFKMLFTEPNTTKILGYTV
jgi:hypothetical protein